MSTPDNKNVRNLPRGLTEICASLPSMLVGVIGSFAFLAVPLFVEAFSSQNRYSDAQAGALGALPVLGMFFGSIGSAAVLGRTQSRSATFVASTVLASTFVLAAPVDDQFSLLAPLLFIGGAAGTVLMAVSFFEISQAGNPDRGFAIFVSMQLGIGALGVLWLGEAIHHVGTSGAFQALAVAALIPIATLPMLPARKTQESLQQSEGEPRVRGPALYLLPAGQFLFGCGIMMIWSVVGVIGDARGWETNVVAPVLSQALVIGIAGALAAALLQGRFPRMAMLCASAFTLSAASAIVAGVSWPVPFLIATACFSFAWNFVPAFQLGFAAELDPSGRLSVLSLAGVKLGYAAGIALGSVVHAGGSFSLNAILAAMAFTLSTLAFAMAARPSRRIVQRPGTE